MKPKRELIDELRKFKRTECCIEAADRLENDDNQIRALQSEIAALKAEIERLHKENFWLSSDRDPSVFLMSNGREK